MTKDASQIRTGDAVLYAPPGKLPVYCVVKSANQRQSVQVPGSTAVDIRVETGDPDDCGLMVAIVPCEIEVRE